MTTTRPPSHPSTHPPARRRVLPVLVTAVVLVAAVAAVLGGRALLRQHYEETRTYPTAASIPAHNGLFQLPDWAPADATDIVFGVQTQGRGRTVRLTTATADLAGCVGSAHPEAGPVPDLDLGDAQERADGLRCGEWFVLRDGDRLTAWTAYA